jgi:Flp pilus assembly protein TadG
MYLRRRPYRRRGLTLVESALVYPTVILFTLGLMIGGLGIFRYQQVAALAREGSRWASVHGSQYAADTGNAAATQQDVHDKIVTAMAAGLDTTQLSCTVTWSPDNEPPNSTVTVAVTYKWVPEALLGSSITLSSTSKVYMAY